MKEELLHILDQSVCLTRKQMRDYLSGSMLPEEVHATQVHLNSCPLCRVALEGFEELSEESLQAIAALNSGFLKEHFDNISPQIHLNSMAPAAALPAHSASRERHMPLFWRVGSIAAGLLLLMGLVWAFEHRRSGEAPVPSLAVSAPHSTAPQPVATTPNTTQQHVPEVSSELKSLSPAPAEPMATQHVDVTHVPASNHEAVLASSSKMVAAKAPAAMSVPATEKTSVTRNANQAGASESAENRPATTSAASDDLTSDATTPNGKPESYSRGSVESALKAYQEGMKSPDMITRYRSMILAAECYEALGQRPRAVELLQKVVAEGPGHERRQARRALRKLQ